MKRVECFEVAPLAHLLRVGSSWVLLRWRNGAYGPTNPKTKRVGFVESMPRGEAGGIAGGVVWGEGRSGVRLCVGSESDGLATGRRWDSARLHDPRSTRCRGSTPRRRRNE